jgi:enoyl-CoA hydratase
MTQAHPQYTHLVVRVDGAVTHVTINRPEALNALNQQVLNELQTALDVASADQAMRAMVLEGAGDRAFVAGADISAMSSMSTDEALAFARSGQRLTRAMEQSPLIIIAKVQGFALGGGCELAMACDIVVASKKAKFAQPEVGLGLVPGFGGTQRLTRRVGLPAALDMLVAGRNLTGDEAFTLGLVSRVTEPERLGEEVGLVLRNIMKHGPHALRETKRLSREAYSMNLDAGLASEATAFAACFGRGESKDGLTAFLEKRKASYCL